MLRTISINGRILLKKKAALLSQLTISSQIASSITEYYILLAYIHCITDVSINLHCKTG